MTLTTLKPQTQFNIDITIASVNDARIILELRKKRYIYSNLILDGTPFQYLANPIPILRGRLVATAVTADAASLSAAAAGAPIILVQKKYSRQFEAAADEFAFSLL